MVTVRRAATRLIPSAHKPPSGDVTTEAEGLRLPAGETGAGGIHNDSRGTYRDYISLHRRLIIMGWSPVKLASFNRLCVSSSSSALCSFIPPPGSRNHYRATGRIDGSETPKRNVKKSTSRRSPMRRATRDVRSAAGADVEVLCFPKRSLCVSWTVAARHPA